MTRYALLLSRYHMEGSEAWCKKPLFYSRACKFVNLGRGSSGSIASPGGLQTIDLAAAFAGKGKKKAPVRTPLLRSDVQDFCGYVHILFCCSSVGQDYLFYFFVCRRSVHLCESCCRREHEMHSITAWESAIKTGPKKPVKANHYGIGEDRAYAARSPSVGGSTFRLSRLTAI